MAEEKKHRTWICSVLFMDIVSYTKYDVEEQMAVRKHYYELVDEVLSNYCTDDYITLDAGDGMAVCYTGDPEDVLLMSLSLRDAFLKIEGCPACPKYEVRQGINLGPVKIVELQGEKRVIGDAINVANRIMGFAGANQLLVSRSYYEVVSHVSKEYFDMFNFLGTKEDKHVRKHDLYEVHPEDDEQDKDGISILSSAGESNHQQAVNTPATFDEQLLSTLESSLAGYIGPLARVIVKKSAKKATSFSQLCDMLSAEVDNESDKQAFVKACQQLA